MGKFVTVTGIVFVMIGTIFSLWSVLGTKSDYVQTVDWHDHQQENFRKDKKKVIIGTVLIITGSLCQIVGMFL